MSQINDLDSLRGTERKCGNCACFRTKPGLAPGQGVCLLVAAEQVMADVPTPRMRGGKPDLDREGRPIMVTTKVPALRHMPALDSGVCFAGWRPIGTRPGETAAQAEMRLRLPALVRALNLKAVSPAEAGGLMAAFLGADLPADFPGLDLAKQAGLFSDSARVSTGTEPDFSGTGDNDGTHKSH